MLDKLIIPEPESAKLPASYGKPTTLLSWDFVAQQMENSQFYWLATVNVQGHPHAAPVWGIWYKDRVHFDGHPQTQWARHLAQNPHIAVHLPNAEQVVMIEGRVQMLEDDDVDQSTWDLLDTTYRTKYGVLHGSPYYVVHPNKVIAWDSAKLEHITRWVFD